VRTLCFSIEVIVLPVSQVERAPRFYVDQIGFKLDVDYCPTDALGSLSSLRRDPTAPSRSGKGLTDAPAGSLRNVYLVVTDLEFTCGGAARTWGQGE
jgi:hypothetical protein